jgi:hypothetical protein
MLTSQFYVSSLWADRRHETRTETEDGRRKATTEGAHKQQHYKEEYTMSYYGSDSRGGDYSSRRDGGYGGSSYGGGGGSSYGGGGASSYGGGGGTSGHVSIVRCSVFKSL